MNLNPFRRKYNPADTLATLANLGRKARTWAQEPALSDRTFPLITMTRPEKEEPNK